MPRATWEQNKSVHLSDQFFGHSLKLHLQLQNPKRFFVEILGIIMVWKGILEKRKIIFDSNSV